MMNIISILKFYPLDQTKMNNDETTKVILEWLKRQAEDMINILEILREVVVWMEDLTARVSELEHKAERNSRASKRRALKLVEQNEELEWML